LNLIVKASIKKKQAKPREIPIQTNQVDWTKYALWGSAFLLLAVATFFIMRESKKDALLRAEKAKQLAELEKAKNIPEPVDPLNESRQLMQAGDFGKFYASVNRAIWKSVSDKLQLPASELNKLNIATGLRSIGWIDDDIIQLKNVLNECEMKLYTPEYNTSDMQRVLSAAEKITSKLNA
jgi:hypothetical protein